MREPRPGEQLEELDKRATWTSYITEIWVHQWFSWKGPPLLSLLSPSVSQTRRHLFWTIKISTKISRILAIYMYHISLKYLREYSCISHTEVYMQHFKLISWQTKQQDAVQSSERQADPAICETMHIHKRQQKWHFYY